MAKVGQTISRFILLYSVIAAVTAASSSSLQLPPWGSKIRLATGFHIFCHNRTKEWPLFKFAGSISLTFTPVDADETLLLYVHNNVTVLEGARKSAGLLKRLQYFSPWSSTKQRLSPFKDNCVGIETSGGFELVAHQTNADRLYFSLLVLGFLSCVVLPAGTNFIPSRMYSLRRNVEKIVCWLFWAAGTIMALPYAVVLTCSRKITGNTSQIFALAAGFPTILALVRAFLYGRQSFIPFVWYLLLVTSFCTRSYYLKPAIKELFCKTLPCAVIFMIWYYCVELEGSWTAIVILSVSLFTLRRVCRPQTRLLTEEEYNRQGREETFNALEDLKMYVNGRSFCETWETVKVLSSPQRFADFASGESHHVSQEEIDLHASNASSLPAVDDDDYDSGSGSEEADDDIGSLSNNTELQPSTGSNHSLIRQSYRTEVVRTVTAHVRT